MPNRQDSYARTARANSGARTHKPRKSTRVQRSANLKSPQLDTELLDKAIGELTLLYSGSSEKREMLDTIAANPTHEVVHLMLENDVQSLTAFKGVRDQHGLLRLVLKQIKHRKIQAEKVMRDAQRQSDKDKPQTVRRPATSMA